MTVSPIPSPEPVAPAADIRLPHPEVIIGWQRARPVYSGPTTGRSTCPDRAREGRERAEDGPTLIHYADGTRYCLRCGRLEMGPHGLNGWRPPSDPDPIN